jgi:hypothetical protein
VGPTGPTGPQGVTGATGAAGVNGANGANGSNGVNGTNGVTGPAGANGANGSNGINGANGVTGATGPAGANGANGSNGPPGPEGPRPLCERVNPGTCVGPTGPPGATGAAGVNGANGANGTNGINGANGATGAAGANGTNGNGEATNFGHYLGATSTGGLASGKQESGGWSVHIQAPAKAEQDQAEAVASFPIPLKFGEKVKLNYRNEKEALLANPPCLGSPSEPVVSPVGNFCAYRGGGSAGIKETGIEVGNVDKNVTPTPFFMGFMGQKIVETSETGTGHEGNEGVLIVFRTIEFSVTAPVASLAAESHLNAVGSWAVAAK